MSVLPEGMFVSHECAVQKKVADSLELDFWSLGATVWILRTKPWSSARAKNTLNHRITLLTFEFHFLTYYRFLTFVFHPCSLVCLWNISFLIVLIFYLKWHTLDIDSALKYDA